MELKNPMLVVTDMDKTIAFYKNVLGLQVAMDFGANKVLTGGLALQTLDTYREFIGTDDISFGGNHFEIYFVSPLIYLKSGEASCTQTRPISNSASP